MCLEPLSPGVLNKRTFDAREQFEDLFTALMGTRSLPDSNNPQVNAVQQLENNQASQLQSLAQAHWQTMLALPRHSQYSRHIIGIDGTWMGVICRWEPNVSSTIHGHPSFAYYQVLKGEYSMDLYSKSTGQLAALTDTRQLGAGQCIWKRGPSGSYDNFIHRVSSCGSGGFTLHLFSENPSLGEHFSVA